MAEKEEKEEIRLKVGELTAREEAGRGIVRIDSSNMHKLGIKEGDVVEIEGKRKTAAIAVRAYPADVGLNIIRMDGIVRRNAGSGVGEYVKVRKADVKEARSVTIAPAERGLMIHASPDLIRQNLYMRPVVKGDIIVPSPVVRKKSKGGTFFDEFFGSDFFEEFFFTPFPGETRFLVTNTEPGGIVRIGDITELEILPELPESLKLEEKAIPAVTYEDIGGIKNVVEKVREMIELPLRHPEIFERLGIDAPKGVLLYGPPGTGKTLLAKAVANESGANFISVNGPEFLSKFYGESLPYDEKILVRKNNLIQLEEIGKIVENKENVEIACFDKNFKLTFKKIKDFIKHKTTGKLFEVKTKSGRKIKVSDYHSLFTLTENGLEPKRTDELKVGSFIAIPNVLPENPNPIKKIDLFEALKEDDLGLTVKPKEVWRIIEKAANKIGWVKTAEILGVKRKYLYDIKNKNVGIRVLKFIKLLEEAKIKLEEVEKERINIYTKRSRIPSQLKLTNSLIFFFGLWLAEGSYSQNIPRLSLNTEEVPLVLAIISNTFERVKVYKNDRTADVWIFNSALGKVMKVLGFKGHAREKKIPSFIFNISKEKLAAFLKGYVSGDGALNTRTYLPQVEIATYSKNLAHDIPYLLLFFGIVAKIYEEEEGRFRICISDKQNLERFLEIGFLLPSKNKKIELYINSCKEEGRIERVPLEAIKSKLSISSSYEGLKSIGKNVLLKMKIPLPLRKILEGDIFFDEIVEIKEIETPDYVYDVEVENTHNFIAGFGGIFAHNSEANLRKIFEDAEKNAPSIIFFDEIDAIAPKREEVTGEVERRIVATLLSLMDGLKSRGKVIVIGATNRPNALDPALRRAGRFDREIEIPVPDRDGRLEIFKIHTRNMPLDKDVDLNWLADITYGYVGADIMALCKEAAMSALRRVLPEIKWKTEEELPKEVIEKLVVKKEDFENALKVVEPSAMREVLVEVPKVKWEDVGDLEEAKQQLKEMVEWPLKNPESFERMGITPPKGILLYGPPGTGKTLLAKAVANESGANFISVKGPEVFSQWFGESERRIRELFRRARQVAPAIIFLDEIDALAPKRGYYRGSAATETIVSQLLTELSGIEETKNVVVIAATNRPDMVDPALLRPGRIDRFILIPPPNAKARLEILKIHTRNMPLKGVDLKEIAEKTEGFSGADLEALCREAAMNALREDIKAKAVEKKHFEEALKKITPSLTKDVQAYYEKFVERSKKIKKPEEEKEQFGYIG